MALLADPRLEFDLEDYFDANGMPMMQTKERFYQVFSIVA